MTDVTNMTTFGVSARCAHLRRWHSAGDLRQLGAEGVFCGRWMCLGGGSNLLFVTGEYQGTLVYSEYGEVTISPDGLVTAGAGATLTDVVMAAGNAGLWGLENLAGIPGSVGGAAVQNAGAYGAEFADHLESLLVYDVTANDFLTFLRDECHFGYRTSVFKHSDCAGRYIVVEARFRLMTEPTLKLGYEALRRRFGGVDPSSLTPGDFSAEVVRLRNSKLPDPRVTGSAGSFFKNPVVTADYHALMQQRCGIEIPSHPADGGVKLSAAWLIDRAGGKSLTCGGAGIWQSMPVVLVNASGNATGAEVAALEAKVIAAVNDKFGVTLEPEVIHIR